MACGVSHTVMEDFSAVVPRHTVFTLLANIVPLRTDFSITLYNICINTMQSVTWYPYLLLVKYMLSAALSSFRRSPFHIEQWFQKWCEGDYPWGCGKKINHVGLAPISCMCHICMCFYVCVYIHTYTVVLLWRNAVPGVLSQKDASRNGVPELLLPGIDISNTSPSPTEFWVTVRSGADPSGRACLLGSRDRIPLMAWMFVSYVFMLCCPV
jgi:hypothetical protein